MKNKVQENIESGQILIWIKRVIAVIMISSVFYTFYAAWASEMLPDKYLIPAIIAIGSLSLVFAYQLSRNKTGKLSSFISIFIAIIFLGSSYAVHSIVSTADSFIASVTQGPSTRYETYEIMALKDSGLDFFKDEINNIGVNSTDTYIKSLKGELGRKSDASLVDIQNLTELSSQLLSNDIDVIAVNVSHLDIINDSIDGFKDRTQSIYTFKIRVKGKTPESELDGKSPFVLYISGIDTYGSINTSSRSDVNMLVVVNPATSSILLVNTPRDYFVELPGSNGVKDKLTHAGIYGIETSEAALEGLYGIDIDRHLKVNFTTLVNVVDTIGGITVKSDYPFKDFKVGDNHLDGRRALEFSRERYSFEEGDLQRGRNQQRVIEGIVAKLSNPQTLLSYKDILLSLQGSLQSNIESSTIKALINNQLSQMNRWSVQSIGVEGTGGLSSTYSMGSLPLYVMYPNENSVYEAKEAIARTLGLSKSL